MVGALNGVSIIMLSTYLVSVGIVIPHLLTIYIFYNIDVHLVFPIMGRTETEIYPDIVVGALNGVSIIMLSTYLISVQGRPAECIFKIIFIFQQIQMV